MNHHAHARSAYASGSAPIRTERGTEYAVFAQMTQRLKSVDETDKLVFPRLAAAVHDNQRLWSVLSDDLKLEANPLPVALKVQLVGLAVFVRKHSSKVLAGTASVAPLIDINTSIMRGLRGEAEAIA